MSSSLTTLGLRERLAGFLGYSHSGERDLYKVYGFPRSVSSEELYSIYQRNGIASRIIRGFSQATWEDMPVFKDEDGETEEDSEFVSEVGKFIRTMNLQRMLERADRLASVGKYGIMVLGFQDGKALDKPLTEGKHKLLYVQPYADYNVTISKFETNEQSPRFGLPMAYSITQGNATGEKQSPMKSLNVHWTRVLHISEFLDTDEVYGTPRLLPVYNDLMNLEKVIGGAAETFWLTANRGIALWADKEANLTADEIEKTKEQMDEFVHQLRRYLVGSGMQAQVLGSDTPDPSPNVDKLLDLIAGGAGMPKRILIGSERGELSSSQDVSAWSSRIEERRNNYAMPMIIRPFIDLMIATGNLPQPSGEWWADWSVAGNLGPKETAEIGSLKMQALKAYLTPGADMVVTPDEFRETVMGLDPLDEGQMDELPPLPEPEPEGGPGAPST